MLLSVALIALVQQATIPPTVWGGPTPAQAGQRIAQGGSAIPSVESVGSVLDSAGVSLTYSVPTGLPNPFTALRATMPADSFRSARVRLSGEIRSANVTEGSALWLRIDDARGRMLKIDNGETRQVKKGSDWTPFETTLDVPAEAQAVVFGVLLWGSGDVNVRRLRIVRAP